MMDLGCNKISFPESYINRNLYTRKFFEKYERISLSSILENRSITLESMCWMEFGRSECQILLIYGPDCILCCRTFPTFQIHCALYIRDKNLGKFSHMYKLQDTGDHECDYVLALTTTGLVCYLRWIQKQNRDSYETSTKADGDYLPPTSDKHGLGMYINSEGEYCCYLEMISVKRVPWTLSQIFTVYLDTNGRKESCFLVATVNEPGISLELLRFHAKSPPDFICTKQLGQVPSLIVPLDDYDYSIFLLFDNAMACMMNYDRDSSEHVNINLPYLPIGLRILKGLYVPSRDFVCILYEKTVHAIHLLTFKEIFHYDIQCNTTDTRGNRHFVDMLCTNTSIFVSTNNAIICFDHYGTLIFELEIPFEVASFALSPCQYQLFILSDSNDVVIINMVKRTKDGFLVANGWWDPCIGSAFDMDFPFTFHEIPFQDYLRSGPVYEIFKDGQYVSILMGHSRYFRTPSILVFDSLFSTWKRVLLSNLQESGFKYAEDDVVDLKHMLGKLVVIFREEILIMFSDDSGLKHSRIESKHDAAITAADHCAGKLYILTENYDVLMLDIDSKAIFRCVHDQSRYIKAPVSMMKHVKDKNFLACLGNGCLCWIHMPQNGTLTSITPLNLFLACICHYYEICGDSGMLIAITAEKIHIWICQDQDFYSEPDMSIESIGGFPLWSFLSSGYILLMHDGKLQKQLIAPDILLFLLENKCTNLIFRLFREYYYSLPQFGFILEVTLYKYIVKIDESEYFELHKRDTLIELVSTIKRLSKNAGVFYGKIIVGVLRKLEHAIWLPLRCLLFDANDRQYLLVFLRECMEWHEWGTAVNYLPLLSLMASKDELCSTPTAPCSNGIASTNGHDNHMTLEELLEKLLENIKDDPELIEQVEQFIEKRLHKDPKEERTVPLLEALMSVLIIE